MKRASYWAIGNGFVFILFAALVPSIILAQATELLARYGASDYVETLAQIAMEDLRVTHILTMPNKFGRSGRKRCGRLPKFQSRLHLVFRQSASGVGVNLCQTLK